MSTCQRIWIEANGLGASGLRYRVTHNGVTLIESTKNPEFDSARALLAQGIVGQLEVWRCGASFPAMRLDIDKAARLTVEEGDREGLRFVRWRPIPLDNVPDAVSGRASSSTAGRNELAAGYPSQEKIGRFPPNPPGKFELAT
jgi:hypothetical protein